MIKEQFDADQVSELSTHQLEEFPKQRLARSGKDETLCLEIDNKTMKEGMAQSCFKTELQCSIPTLQLSLTSLCSGFLFLQEQM